MLYQPACHTPPKREMSTLGDQGIATPGEIVAFTLHFLNRWHHENTGLRTMKELARGYMTITKDLTHVMVCLKALYRSRAIPCAGQRVYASRHRAAWLEKIIADS